MQNEDHRLSPTSEERLKLQYKGSVRSSHDPYKRAVYCLLARCEVNDNHSEVCVKTDDYMWLKVRLKLIFFHREILHVICFSDSAVCVQYYSL